MGEVEEEDGEEEMEEGVREKDRAPGERKPVAAVPAAGRPTDRFRGAERITEDSGKTRTGE